MSFEWQTDEDYRWDEEPASPEPAKPKRPRWPWLVLLGVFLAGTAVFLIFSQLNQRVETATDDVEADLAASYAVLQRAAQNQDENLFNSLLSGRDPEWSQAQRELLNVGLLFDRVGFGLTWLPSLAETAVLSQTLSPNLTAAELTTLQNYSLDIGNGLTQTVQLARVDVYRLGEDRWLYAPPEREFWGVRRRLEGQLLSVRYPARDEQIVHRLAADLEARLVQLCGTPGYSCPPDARVRVHFSPEPDSLAEATFIGALTRADMGDVLEGRQAVRLPTPSLVGLPQDEVGYQALLRGYSVQMLTIVINDVTGWECCVNVPFYRAAVERQLYEFGVGSWPLTETAVSLPADLTLGDGAHFWNAPFPEMPTDFIKAPAPYAIVDFLTTSLRVPISQIAASLAESGSILSWHMFMDQWLIHMTGHPISYTMLSHAFQGYVAQWQPVPAKPLPESGLMLSCATRNPLRLEQGIYYFDNTLAEPVLLESIPADTNLFFTGLPGGTGVAVGTQNGALQPETYLLFNETERVDVDWSAVEGVTSRPPLAIPTTTSENGRYLLWTIQTAFANGNFFAVTDLDACHEGDRCEAVPVGGYPVWSPSAEQLITLSVIEPWWTEGLRNGMMLLRDEPTSPAINSPGFGASIFWLDETQFGYLTQFQNGLQQLVISDVALSRPRVLLTNESLPDFLSGSDVPTVLNFEFAQPLPNNPRSVLILAQDDTLHHHVIWFDRVNEAVTMVVPLSDWPGASLLGYRFSPDGRFLLIALTHGEENIFVLVRLDANSPQRFVVRLEGSTPLPRHFYANWSPDGEWLAVPELGYIRLWHKGGDERLLNFADLGCTNAVWVDRIEP